MTGLVAGLACTRATAIAADVLLAESGLALIRRAAGLARIQLGNALSGVALEPGCAGIGARALTTSLTVTGRGRAGHGRGRTASALAVAGGLGCGDASDATGASTRRGGA